MPLHDRLLKSAFKSDRLTQVAVLAKSNHDTTTKIAPREVATMRPLHYVVTAEKNRSRPPVTGLT